MSAAGVRADDALRAAELAFLRLARATQQPTTEAMVAPDGTIDAETKRTLDALYDEIRDALAPDDAASAVDLQLVERHLYLRHTFDRLPIARPLLLLATIRDATRVHSWKVLPFDHAQPWEVALAAAAKVVRATGGDLSHPSAPNERTQRMLLAAEGLRAAGFKVTLSNARPVMHEAERMRVASRLRGLVATAGPLHFLEALLAAVATAFDAPQERYQLAAGAGMTGRAPTDLPIGYLTNMCASVLRQGVLDTPPSQADAGRAVALASHLVAIMDVQWSLPYDVLGIQHDNIIGRLTDLALMDSLREFPQASPTRARWIVREIYERFPRELQSTPSLTGVTDLMACLSSATAGAHGPCFLTRGTLLVHSGLSEASLERLLPSFTSKMSEVNSNFLLPEHFPEATLPKRPLISTTEGYWVVDPMIAAAAFLQAFEEAVKRISPNGGAILGAAIEQIIRDRATAVGLAVRTGAYKVGDEQGECDCVVETDESIYFVECKYREFHATARIRDSVLFQDLRRAVLEPIAQAGAHEVLLRRTGHLALKANNREYVLELRNRRVERIAVTLRDLGALQSREVVERIITLATGAHWQSSDVLVGPSLGSLRRVSRELRR